MGRRTPQEVEIADNMRKLKEDDFLVLTGTAAANLLMEWAFMLGLRERAEALIETTRSIAGSDDFVTRLAPRLNRELTRISHLDGPVMKSDIEQWDQELTIALVSRLGHRAPTTVHKLARGESTAGVSSVLLSTSSWSGHSRVSRPLKAVARSWRAAAPFSGAG